MKRNPGESEQLMHSVWPICEVAGDWTFRLREELVLLVIAFAESETEIMLFYSFISFFKSLKFLCFAISPESAKQSHKKSKVKTIFFYTFERKFEVQDFFKFQY